MITLKEISNKTFSNSEEALKFLIENKKIVIANKCSAIKRCDGVSFFGNLINEKDEVIKAGSSVDISSVNQIKITAIGNTCNFYDSHGDVSINGSWNRTAKNTKEGLHLQEHKCQFDHIIAEGPGVKYAVEIKSWKEIGYEYEGSTECLVQYSIAEKEDNPYMFKKYIQGKVKQHSAGLRYVKLELCVNNNADWAKEEKENWDKYYPSVVNKDDVDERGYFWAVLEQKIIEVSAVPRGSNPATPTTSVEPVSDTSTKQDPADATPESETKSIINLNIF
ncbi:hypothetical protein [Chryseobacterium daeguense]|uniref:hypothetical protein n=1 Tax=Chryseobacterium daeguense TaxID=412438 RepID=UPI0003F766E7|nr:hypothetical protein [Chryseobacterium daeguense]